MFSGFSDAKSAVHCLMVEFDRVNILSVTVDTVAKSLHLSRPLVLQALQALMIGGASNTRGRTALGSVAVSAGWRFAMTSSTASSRLLNSPMMKRAARDPHLEQAFASDQATTSPASKPRNGLGRHFQRFISNGRRFHPSSPDKEA